MTALVLLLLALPATGQVRTIPQLTEEQGRVILRSTYPGLALRAQDIVGPPYVWTRASPIQARLNDTTLITLDLYRVQHNQDTTLIVVNRKINDTLVATMAWPFLGQGPCFVEPGISAYDAPDKSLMLGIQTWASVGDTVVATVAWLPTELFSYTTVQDTLQWLIDYFRLQIVRKQEQTDNAFWYFHEKETGVGNVRYFAGSFTDAQVDSIRQTGADIYYMGTKSGGKTPIRGYGK